MSVFVDTSALLAALNAADLNHSQAGSTLRALIESDIPLVTTSYVLVETLALVQRRLGIEAVRIFQSDVAPLLDVEWMDETSHHLAMTVLLFEAKRHLSLVDCASFETMRRRGLTHAFTFDQDFADRGFASIPG